MNRVELGVKQIGSRQISGGSKISQGAPTQKIAVNLLFGQLFFPANCMKIKEIKPLGVSPWRPHLDPSMLIPTFLLVKIKTNLSSMRNQLCCRVYLSRCECNIKIARKTHLLSVSFPLSVNDPLEPWRKGTHFWRTVNYFIMAVYEKIVFSRALDRHSGQIFFKKNS